MPTAAYVVHPDAVLLVRGVLEADSGVTTVVGTRVGSVSPDDTTTPWVRISRIGGGRSPNAPQRLSTANVQVDAFVPPAAPGSSALYSGNHGAMALALLAEAALFDAKGFSNSTGVITYVTQLQGLQSLPDTSRTPPTPRVLATYAITVRPL